MAYQIFIEGKHSSFTRHQTTLRTMCRPTPPKHLETYSRGISIDDDFRDDDFRLTIFYIDGHQILGLGEDGHHLFEKRYFWISPKISADLYDLYC
jgi:hypothetical protein